MDDFIKKAISNFGGGFFLGRIFDELTKGKDLPQETGKDSVEVCQRDPFKELFADICPSGCSHTIFGEIKKDDDDHSFLQNAFFPYAIFPFIGLIRVFGTRAGNKYEVRFLFPNLDEISVSLEVDNKNNITVNNEGEGTIKDSVTKRVRKIRVSKVEEFAGRVRLEFRDRPAMDVDLTVVEPMQGSAMGKRVVMSPIQPEYVAPELFAMTEGSASPATVKVKHVEFVGDSGLRGKRGGIRTWQITLSNGDVIEVEAFSDHAGKGTFRPEKAALNRMDTKDPNERVSLKVSESGTNRMRVEGEGYELEVPFDLRGGSRGTLEIKADGIEVTGYPAMRPAQEPATMAAQQPTWLVPTKAGLQVLNRPLWGKQSVELSFVGEVAGIKIDEMSSLVIRGTFEDNTFVPNFEGKTFIERIIFAEGQRIKVVIKKTHDKNGFTLQIQLGDGSFIEADPQFFGRVFGFGTNDTVVTAELSRVYEQGKVTAPDVELKNVNYIPAEGGVVEEVLRFISRNTADFNDGHAVTVQDGNPSIVRVAMGNKKALYFERKSHSTEIEYRLLVSPSTTSVELLELPANGMTVRSLEGLVYKAGTSLSVLNPWRGDLRETERDGRVVIYQDWADATVEARVTASGRHRGLSIFISKTPPAINIGGSLAGLQVNGRNVAMFELENGRMLAITLPHSESPENEIFKIAAGTDFYSGLEEGLKVEILDVKGAAVFTGSLIVEDGAWVVKNAGGKNIFSLEMDIDHASTPRVKLREPPVVIVTEPPTEEVPIEEVPAPPTRPERLAEPTRKRRVVVEQPLADRSFPWEEGAFLLPAEETRREMRAAYGKNRPQEGAKTRFKFYGKPEGGTFSAREINLSMRKLGNRSTKYFQWELDVDMAYTGGEWVPDSRGKFNITRRFPRFSGAPGFFSVPLLGGEFPIRVTNAGTGWGLVVGRDKTIQPFRATVEYGGDNVLVPDFGISLGGPQPAALDKYKDLATRLLEYGELQPSDFFRIEKKPMAVDVQLTEDVSGRLTPEFGDPIFRGSTLVGGNISIVEFSPGYSEHLPDARFTQLQVYDGNGFNWRLIYQHGMDGTSKLIACESFGRRVDMDRLVYSITSTDGTIEASGVLPARYNYAGGGQREIGIPFSVAWRRDGDVFSIDSIRFDQYEMGVVGIKFNPKNWGESDIFMVREGTSIGITTRVLLQNRPTSLRGIPHPSAVQPARYQFVGLPENYVELAKGVLADGSQLPNTVKVRFKLESSESQVTGLVISVPLAYDRMLRAYVPMEERGLISVEVNGQLVLAQIKPSRNGQNYELLMPVEGEDVATVYLGNFTAKETLDGNRPVPVIWTSDEHNANRSRIKRILEDKGIGTGVAYKREIRSNADFVAVIKHGARTYNVPMKLYQQIDGKKMVVIRGVATCEEGGVTRDVAVRYYMPYYGAPAAIELDGNSFEIRLDAQTNMETKAVVTVQWSSPGENGLHGSGRSKASVLVEASDQSARVFVDLNPTSFTDEIDAAMKVEGEVFAKRVLHDAISNRFYELVFNVKKGALGRPELELVGLAELNVREAVPIPVATMTDGLNIYIQMPDGHSFSVNKSPTNKLQVTSYGRVMDRHLLSRIWTIVESESETFSPRLEMPEMVEVAKFYEVKENRLNARDAAAAHFGIVPEVIWDTARSFPGGLAVTKKKWDPQRPSERIYQRGPIKMVVTMGRQKGVPIASVKVTYEVSKGVEIDIPAEVFVYEGRPYVGLGGALKGVVFLADPYRQFREVTHPALREALERDIGKVPIKRPKFTPADDGTTYEYPPVEGALEQAINKQLKASRMWRLQGIGALPEDGTERELLAELFASDGAKKPDAVRVIEKISQNPVAKVSIRRILSRLATAELQLSDMDELVVVWNAYEASPSLKTLAWVGYQLVRLSFKEGNDPKASQLAFMDTRKRGMLNPLGKDVIIDIVKNTHGEGLVKYLGLEQEDARSMEDLSTLIRRKLGEARWAKIHEEIAEFEKGGMLTIAEEVSLLLESAHKLLEGPAYDVSNGAKRMAETVNNLKDVFKAPGGDFRWNGEGANGYLTGIGVELPKDPIMALRGGVADTDQVLRVKPPGWRADKTLEMKATLERFREAQRAARRAKEARGKAEKK